MEVAEAQRFGDGAQTRLCDVTARQSHDRAQGGLREEVPPISQQLHTGQFGGLYIY